MAEFDNTADNTLISGSANADSIVNSGNNVTIAALGGNDTIINTGVWEHIEDGGFKWSNSGSNVSISGGDGADVIENTGNNVTINGGAGNDTITNTGSIEQYYDTRGEILGIKGKDVSINGGAGNDLINLDGNIGASIKIQHEISYEEMSLDTTVNTGEGDDTISVGANVQSFKVEEFSSGDVIKFSDNVTAIATVDGGIVASVGSNNRTVTIYGLDSIASSTEGWSVNSANSIVYQKTPGGSIEFSGTDITYGSTVGKPLFTIDGLNSSDSLSLNDSVVAVGEEALWARAKDTITIDNGYTFAMIKENEPSGDIQIIGGDTIISEDGVYKFDRHSKGIVTINASNVKLIGATSQLTDVFIDVTSDANLWIENLDIATGNTGRNLIKFAWGTTSTLTVKGNNSLTNSANSVDNNQAVINIGSGINITGDGILSAEFTGSNSYGAAIGGDSGQDLSNSTINIGGSVIIDATAYYGAGIGVGSSYGYDDTISAGTINIGGNATVTAYSRSSSAQGIGAGLGSSAGTIYVYKNATAISNNAALEKLTADSDPTFTGATSASVIYGTLGGAGWHQDSSTNNVTFNLEGENDYFTLESGKQQITYHEANLGETQVELGGVTDYSSLEDPTNNVVYLSNDNFTAAGVSVLANSASYAFYLNKADYSGKTFYGASSADTVTLYGLSNLSVSGGGGDDSINNNEGYQVTFIYSSGDGNDTISGFNEDDTLQIGDGTGNYSTQTSGDDVIVTVGKGKITLQGAAALSNVNIAGNQVADEWTLNGTTATYGNATETLITVKGVKSLDGLAYDGDKTVTVSKSSLSEDNEVTISDGYTLALGTDVTKSKTKSKADYSNQVYTAAGAVTAGYLLGDDGKSISYVEPLTFKFTGLNKNAAAKYFVVDEEAKTIRVSKKIVTADGSVVTMTSSDNNYKLSYGKTMTKAKAATTTLDGTNYTVNYSSAGYDIAGNTIRYVKSGETALELSGIASSPTEPADEVVNLKAANFDSNVSVKSNAGGFSFSMASGTYTGKTFTGSAAADTINNAGASLIINAGAGKDSIVSSGKNVTISGGDGADYINSTGAGSSILGGKGADTISGSAGADYLSGGDGNDSILGGAGNDSLYGGKGNDYLVGGKGTDYVSGGAGNDTLWGGTTGNDTLLGGTGADTFIYKPGEGTDTITDYSNSQGDILQILNADGSTAGYTKSRFAGGTLTLTVEGGGTVVFENVTSSDTFNINGKEHTVVKGKTYLTP